MSRRVTRNLSKFSPGDAITATRLSGITEAVNANTKAIARPQQKTVQTVTQTGGGGSIGNETFSAGAANMTTELVTVTDNAGNTHDVERITQIVLTEGTSGRTMTLNLSY